MNSVYLLLSVLFFVTPLIYGQSTTYTSFSSSCNTWSKYNSWLNTLTTLVPANSNQRCVHSSGGAAGGIVSEGQGYGVMLGATVAASLGPSNANYATALNYAYQLFKGWKAMCIGSTVGNGCQSSYLCPDTTVSPVQYYPCLPHWKFNDQLGNWEYGSAPDGDVDGITGTCLLAALTASNKPTYWNEIASWCYASIKQFYMNDVEQDTVAGNPESVLKLGSCWGGISCMNPSYLAPGQYRFFANWAQTYGASFAPSSNPNEVSTVVANMNQLIKTSYKILLAAQNAGGLVTNWYIPNQSDLTKQGTTNSGSCDGSGTPVDQYGAEAARIVWRVAFDYIMFGSANAKTFLDKVATEVVSKYTSGGFNNLDTGGLVNSIFSSWQSTAFIYGPTFCALVDNLGLANQAAALAEANNIVCSGTVSDYYSGSWITIATLTLSGDLGKSAGYCGGTPPGPQAPVPPVAPVPVPVTPPPVPVPVTPPPVPVPVVPSPPTSNTCTLKGCAINLYYSEFVASGTVSSTSMICKGDGRTIPCAAVSGTTGKYSCQDGNACIGPVPVVNGAHCPYSIPTSSSTCTNGNSNPWWIEFYPPSSSYSLNLGAVLCANGAFQGNAQDGGGKLQISIKGSECDNPVPIYDGSFCKYTGATYGVPQISSLVSDASTSSDPNMVSVPVWGIGLMIAGCVAIVIALIIAVAVIKRKRSTEEIV